MSIRCCPKNTTRKYGTSDQSNSFSETSETLDITTTTKKVTIVNDFKALKHFI